MRRLVSVAAAAAALVLLGASPVGPGINPSTPNFWNGSAWVPVTTSAPLPVAPTSSTDGVTTTMTSGSVATQNAFQSILASSSTRKGCTLQNTSSTPADVLYVYFGANGSATKAGSYQVQPNTAIYCTSNNGQPLTDNVSITCADATPANCLWVLGNQ